jgi:hypothetical protein
MRHLAGTRPRSGLTAPATPDPGYPPAGGHRPGRYPPMGQVPTLTDDEPEIRNGFGRAAGRRELLALKAALVTDR